MHLAKAAMIAVIDDDISVRRAAKTLLSSLGYTTATFQSAEEFLASGGLEQTACLVTDVHMPGMSGVELQDYLIANGDLTPVIFLTAFPEDALRARVFGAGAFGFLTKPFSAESLIACLNLALAHPRANGPH
jgi:FixJ family two-component response regulator